jgi:hypothetical protein
MQEYHMTTIQINPLPKKTFETYRNKVAMTSKSIENDRRGTYMPGMQNINANGEVDEWGGLPDRN